MAADNMIDEFGLIARYFAPLAKGYWGAFDLLDDAAVLRHGGDDELVVTMDVLVEGVHFQGQDPPSDIARKALRVNLSDLAAMGARPVAYTLGIALPHGTSEPWIAAFSAGLAADQELYELPLIGGDTVATPGPSTVSISAFGTCERGKSIRRNGARPGDRIFVSGTVGDAALGLHALQRGRTADDSDVAPLIARYLVPQPRVALGQGLFGLVHAMIDISDGLVADLAHVAAASEVSAEILLERVPISDKAKGAIAGNPDLEHLAITGGDDYELLFAAPESAIEAIGNLGRELGIAISEIGRVSTGSGVMLIDRNGRNIDVDSGGYRHF